MRLYLPGTLESQPLVSFVLQSFTFHLPTHLFSERSNSHFSPTTRERSWAQKAETSLSWPLAAAASETALQSFLKSRPPIINQWLVNSPLTLKPRHSLVFKPINEPADRILTDSDWITCFCGGAGRSRMLTNSGCWTHKSIYLNKTQEKVSLWVQNKNQNGRLVLNKKQTKLKPTCRPGPRYSVYWPAEAAEMRRPRQNIHQTHKRDKDYLYMRGRRTQVGTTKGRTDNETQVMKSWGNKKKGWKTERGSKIQTTQERRGYSFILYFIFLYLYFF